MNANRFLWLLKREFWEYRGSFFWAPLITAMAMLGLCLMAIVSAEVLGHRHGVELSGIHLDMLTQHLSDADIAKAHRAMDLGLLSLGFPLAITLFFVTFFYCLGALYNDRADRSVLFWKSLPLSDTETVLAKVVTVALIAPAFAVAALIALQLGFLLLLSAYTLAHGVNALVLLWSPTHLLALWLKLIALIPLNALWALPSIGWLLLCSSYARSKPFLWAVLLPIVTGFFVWWFDLMRLLSLSASWFWHHVVGRLLLSLAPASWMDAKLLKDEIVIGGGPDSFELLLPIPLDRLRDVLATPNLWIGAAAGAAMIAAAIWFRRSRIECYA
jgi:ABC-2 type transport system permease protein